MLSIMVSDHVLLHSYPHHDSNASTRMIWVTLNMPSAAEECRELSGNVREFYIGDWSPCILWSSASDVCKSKHLKSFSTTSFQVFLGLPLYLKVEHLLTHKPNIFFPNHRYPFLKHGDVVNHLNLFCHNMEHYRMKVNWL